MPDTQTGARVSLSAVGSANVTTGVPVLDHLIAELAGSGRFRVTLEVAPDAADEAVALAGRALGAALGELLADPDAARTGWSLVPSAEALASCALERDDEARLVSNADFSDERVGGLGTDVASRFLEELALAAGLNLHVRVLEGTESRHVLTAIYKSVGSALGQACRSVP